MIFRKIFKYGFLNGINYMKKSSSKFSDMFNNTSASTQEQSPVNINTFTAEAVAELVPIALLVTIANGVVLVLFTKNTKLRTAPNYVLFSLAVCDFMTGIINVPLFIIVAFTPVVKSLEVRYYMAILVSVLNNLTAISSCYHILVATTEKYLSVVWPIKHRFMTRRTVAKVVKVVWALSFIVAFSPFAWVKMEDRETQARLTLGHVIFCLIAVFLLPYAFMIYAFMVIFKSISDRGKARRGATLERPFLSRQAALEKRCLILFVAMATVFLLCWLPWFILMLLFKVKKDVNSLEIPAHVFVLVRYATSIINPVLYTFFRRDFKKALHSLCSNSRLRCLTTLDHKPNGSDTKEIETAEDAL